MRDSFWNTEYTTGVTLEMSQAAYDIGMQLHMASESLQRILEEAMMANAVPTGAVAFRCIEAMTKELAETPSYVREWTQLPDQPWSIAVSNPRVVYVGNGLWLLDELSIKEISNHELGCVPPLLVHHSVGLQFEEPSVGTILRLSVNSDLKTRFEMVGSSGDYVRHSNDWVEWESMDGQTFFSDRYIFAGVALALELGVNGDAQLDPTMNPELQSFIPTWKDKRPCLTVDRTRGKAAVWHDEIRCQQCNGRVLLKFPRGNQVDSCRCPHSVGQFHDIHFPHLVDDRTFDEQVNSVENVPKEAS